MSPFFPFRRFDAALVRQALEQRPEAFDALVLRHQRKAHAIARATGVGSSEVDDVVQQSFLQAFRGLPGLREPESFGPWLLRIVRNTARNHIRDEARAAALSGGGSVESQLTALPAPPVTESLEVRELRDRLWKQVAELPDGTREAIHLFYHEGESVREVARALEVSVTAVKQRLKRGRDLLREELWQELEDSLRDMLPAARVWRRKARAMSLLLLSAAPASWSSSTLAAAASSSSLSSASMTSSPGIVKTTLGGLTVTGKKLAISFSLAFLLVAGGLLVITRASRQGAESTKPALPSTTRVDAGSSASRVAPGAAPEKTAEESRVADDRAAPGASPTLPISIEGRVTSEGAAVSSAAIVALPLAAWLSVSRTADDEVDLAARLSALREACDRQSKDVPRARSSPDGSFAFRGLAGGEYRLFASHAGHVPNADAVVSVAAGSATRRDIELARGEKISGRVVDSAGKPVAGANVTAEPIETALLRGRVRDLKRILDLQDGKSFLDEAHAESGDDGSFEIPCVTPGVHALLASRRGFLAGEAVQAPGGARGVVVKLRAAASIAGRVVNREKKGVAGAKVAAKLVRLTEVHRIFDWTGNEDDQPEESGREARTDADGRFRLDSLEGRAHDLTVTAESYSSLYREVEAADGETDLGDLTLDEGASIRGQVFAPSGHPAARAHVSAWRAARSVMAGNAIARASRALLREANTDVQGRFELAGLPSGKVDLRAEVEDLGAAELQGIEAGARDVKLTITEGSVIHGKVIDGTTGAPVVNAEVRIGFIDPKQTRTGASGEFVIRGFLFERNHRGMTSLRVKHRDYSPYSDLNAFVLGSTESSPIEVRLSAGTDLRGRVADADGRPIPGAQVWVESVSSLGVGEVSTGETRAFTDADGGFRLTEPQWARFAIEEIKVRVVASHPAFALGHAGPFGAPPTGEPWPSIDVVLTKGAVLEGKVTTAAGAPVAGVKVSVRDADPRGGGSAPDLARILTTRSAFTARDGTYRLTSLEAGAVDVEAAAPGFARTRLPGVRLDPETTRHDLILERGASIRGRVVDGAGSPVPAAEVTAVLEASEAKDADAGPHGSRFTERMRIRSSVGLALAVADETGAFELSNLPDGSYSVLARASGYGEAQKNGTRAGEDVRDITLSRFSAVRGTVRDVEADRPIASFSVYVIDRARRNAEKDVADWRVGSEGDLNFVDPAGRFLYDGLRPGDYEVIVSSSGYLAHHEDVTLAAGEELPLDVKLGRGARIEGVVTDAETGRPIAGAQMSCNLQIPREELEAMTKRGRFGFPMTPISGSADATSRADGSFVLDGLLPGEYAVWAWHPYFKLVHDRDNRTILEPMATATAAVHMAPTGRVEGEVSGLRTAAGAGVRIGHRVIFERVGDAVPDGEKSETERWGTGLDPVGRFHAEGLNPGRFRLSIKSQPYRQGKFIELTPGGGIAASEPAGREETRAIGEVEVRAGETTRFHGNAKD